MEGSLFNEIAKKKQEEELLKESQFENKTTTNENIASSLQQQEEIINSNEENLKNDSFVSSSDGYKQEEVLKETSSEQQEVQTEETSNVFYENLTQTIKESEKDVETLKNEEESKLVYLEIEKLVPNKRNYFQEYNEEEKIRMKESIKLNGILHPILVRPIEDSKYEILSGHNRTICAKELGLETVPVIIKENVDDEMADLIMIETNIVTRDNMSVMTKARAYKEQADIYKKKNVNLNQANKSGETLKQKLEKDSNIKYRQITNLIKLNDLILEFQEMLDEGKLNIKTGVSIAFLSKSVQKKLYNLIIQEDIKLSESKVKYLREKELELGKQDITTEFLENVFLSNSNQEEKIVVSFTFDELNSLFGTSEFSKEELKEKIISFITSKEGENE